MTVKSSLLPDAGFGKPVKHGDLLYRRYRDGSLLKDRSTKKMYIAPKALDPSQSPSCNSKRVHDFFGISYSNCLRPIPDGQNGIFGFKVTTALLAKFYVVHTPNGSQTPASYSDPYRLLKNSHSEIFSKKNIALDPNEVSELVLIINNASSLENVRPWTP